MRATAMIVIGLIACGLPMPSYAQDKDEKEDCLDTNSKYILHVLPGVLKEAKPSGECALSKWSIARHGEILRMYGAEPEECRKSDLGKKVAQTLTSIIRQETNRRNKACR